MDKSTFFTFIVLKFKKEKLPQLWHTAYVVGYISSVKVAKKGGSRSSLILTSKLERQDPKPQESNVDPHPLPPRGWGGG